MTGRDDYQMAVENTISKRIEGKPAYVRSYYLSMQYPSMRTKSEYLKHVVNYLNYISSELDVDISDPHNFNTNNVAEFLHSIQYKITTEGKVPTSVAYRKLVWTCLNNFFSYLVSTHEIESNPLQSIKRPTGHDNVKRVSLNKVGIRNVLEDISEYDGEFKTRDLAMVILFLQTGIRVTALSELDIENIRFQAVSSDGKIHSATDVVGASIIVVDKRNKEFEKVISDTAARYLYLWLVDRDIMLTKMGIQNQTAVFINKDGQRISPHGIEKTMTKLMPQVDGKQITPHALRRTYGTMLYQQTKDIYYVQRAMGHSSPATTQMYIIDDGEDKRKAADIMDKICFGTRIQG